MYFTVLLSSNLHVNISQGNEILMRELMIIAQFGT